MVWAGNYNRISIAGILCKLGEVEDVISELAKAVFTYLCT